MVLLLVSAVSCNIDMNNTDYDDNTIERIKSSLPDKICVFNPNEFLMKSSPAVRSEAGSVTISPNDLDYDNIKFLYVDDFCYAQIPVTTPGIMDSTIVRFIQIEEDTPMSPIGKAKTYLVHRSKLDGSEPISNIITIVPQPKFMSEEQINAVDCFDISGLNGVVFHAKTDGQVGFVDMAINGELVGRYKVIDNIEKAVTVVYLSPDGPKGDVGPILLDPAVCIGEKKDKPFVDGEAETDDGSGIKDHEDDVDKDEYIFGFTGGGNGYIGGGGGGVGPGDGNTNTNTGNTGGSDLNNDIFIVNIGVVGQGTVEGAGYYKAGETIHCKAMPKDINGKPLSKFVYWKTDKNYGFDVTSPQISFSTMLVENIYLTAVFADFLPCSSGYRTDPLAVMEILGTKNNGIAGGQYGNARGSFHNGIDLAAPIGTPVYSTMKGIVSDVRTGIPPGDYDAYLESGGRLVEPNFNTGNAVYVTGEINGREHTSFYWHLSDVLVVKGQEVTVGTLLGFTGVSGNASSNSCAGPHLHYGMKGGGRWSGDYYNPETYLHAMFDEDGANYNDCKE